MHGQMKEMSFDFEILAPLDFHVCMPTPETDARKSLTSC